MVYWGESTGGISLAAQTNGVRLLYSLTDREGTKTRIAMRWMTYRRLEQQYAKLQGRWSVGVTAGTAQLLERLRRGCNRQ